MKRRSCDTFMSQDNRNMNLKETCPETVKKMMIIRWEKKSCTDGAEAGRVS